MTVAKRRRPPVDLSALLESWTVHLLAARKSPLTIRSYVTGVRMFLAWCETEGRPATLDRPTLDGFTASLLASGAEAATARVRQLAVRRFSAWLAQEEEIPRDDLLGVRPPKLDEKVIPVLTEAELGALVKACAGKDLRDRRDEAVVRLMAETGARAGEVVDMTTADVDLRAGLAVVRRGKGGKGRRIPFGPQTGASIDRYLRARRAHRLAETSALWLGDRGKQFTYYALHKSLAWRAETAGIKNFTPHVLRHTAASRWLARGGTEGGLMAVAGWTRRDMIDRYVRATAAENAAAEARRLGLGEF